MRVTFNNNNNSPSYTSYNMMIRGKANKNVPYLYNQVLDTIKGKGVPATFEMGASDVIILSPESKLVAKNLRRDLNDKGIRISRSTTK